MHSALRRLRAAPWEMLGLTFLALYPIVPIFDVAAELVLGVAPHFDHHLVNIFIFAILALGLNMQVGYAGLLQLGIAAFFAIGAFACGVLTVSKYPFQLGFWGALLIAPCLSGMAGLALGGPTMRLRGDYLAIVTLGFGEIVRVVLLNLENITDGSRGLNPIASPWIPPLLRDALWDAGDPGGVHFLTMYYVTFGSLVLLLIFFATIERSRLGRAFVALREDELASSSIGLSPARSKLTAFACGAAIAGYAGALYATNLTTTAEPSTYDFNYSVMVLCCVIIGGLGSRRGVVLGALVLLTFDNVVAPIVSQSMQQLSGEHADNVLLTFNNWRWFIFGFVLVLMMRFRPEGLWPASKIKAELHAAETSL